MRLYYESSDSLMHYGILGMHWGIRRYQNADGSLTSAGKRRYSSETGDISKKDIRWVKRNSKKITKKAQKGSSKELSRYAKELMRDPNSRNKSGKLSAATINSYNQKMASLMSEQVSNIRSPSGKVIRYVAKRGEVGVHMALADQGYNMDQLKNGIWSSGRVAYKQDKVNMA